MEDLNRTQLLIREQMNDAVIPADADGVRGERWDQNALESKMKNLKISVKFLKKIGACKSAIKWFSENVGTGEYLVSDLIQNKSLTFCYRDVTWLMRNRPEFRTSEILEYYKSLNPDYLDVGCLMRGCPEFRTSEMLEYYKSLDPDYFDVCCLMRERPEFRTSEMLEYYKSLYPDYFDVCCLICECPEFRTSEVLEYYKSLNPDRGNIKRLMYECPELEKMIEKEGAILGKFVTAKLKGRNDSRQGWVIFESPLLIQGISGTIYECEGAPVTVINPPDRLRLTK